MSQNDTGFIPALCLVAFVATAVIFALSTGNAVPPAPRACEGIAASRYYAFSHRTGNGLWDHFAVVSVGAPNVPRVGEIWVRPVRGGVEFLASCTVLE